MMAAISAGFSHLLKSASGIDSRFRGGINDAWDDNMGPDAGMRSICIDDVGKLEKQGFGKAVGYNMFTLRCVKSLAGTHKKQPASMIELHMFIQRFG